MTTQEINRYIAVASKWEDKFTEAKLRLDSSERMIDRYDNHVKALESQLKIQDTAIERKDAEIGKLKRFDKPYVFFLIGYVSGLFMDWLL